MVEHTFETLDQAAGTLEGIVRDIDVATLTGLGATRLAERLVKAERVLAACRAAALRRAADANQWRTAGDRSPAAWAARLTGTTAGRAAADLETDRLLDGLPAAKAARAAGELSDTQARDVASAASADPSVEAELLRRAKVDDAAAFKRRCDAIRAAAERDEHAARERIRKARSFRSWTDGTGAFCATIRGLAEDGAALLAAMKLYQDQAFHTARRRGDHERTEAYAYDALMHLARHHCTSTTARSTGTGTGTGRRGPTRHRDPGDTDAPAAGRPAPPTGPDTGGPSGGASGTLFPDGTARTGTATRAMDDAGTVHDRDAVLAECFRPGPRAKLIVRIDHTALVRGHTIPGEVCEIAGIGPIPVATARELARDAFLTAIVTDGIDIRTVVHLGRAATAHQRTALEARGKICAVPGCGLVHGLEIDHVDGWAITRRTHIDQLDWLCRHHHQQKTHHSWHLAGPPGNRT